VAESERKYRRIVETANDGIWMLDDRLVTFFANQRLASLLGYTVSEMLGRSLSDFVFEEDSRQKAADLRQPSASNSRNANAERTGRSCGRLSQHTPTFDEDGAFTGVLKMVSDITEHRRADQERLRARETALLLSEAVDQTADSVIVTDSSGRIEYVNPAFEATTGFTREESPRQHAASPQVGTARRDLLQGNVGCPARRSAVSRHPDQFTEERRALLAEQTITPIKDAHGGITHLFPCSKT